MIAMIIKTISEQVLGSGPALERSIIHVKYGMLGSMAAAIVVAAGVSSLLAALYFWLTATGMSTSSALLIVGAALILSAALIMIACNYLAKKEANKNRAIDQRHQTAPQTDPQSETLEDLKKMAAVVFQSAAEGLVEGFVAGQEKRKSASPQESEEEQDSTGTQR